MQELRLRTRVNPATVAQQVGKQLGDDDYGLLLTGPCRVLKPDGGPLAVFLPGHLLPVLDANPDVYAVLHSLRSLQTDNRGLASGSRRLAPPDQKRSRTRKVRSAIVGAADPMGTARYCRLTSWTGQHLPEFGRLSVLLKEIGAAFAAHVPDRYAAQMGYVTRTDPDWVVPGTPFTTITVNNTYATGTHKDQGDLAAGFSCLAVLRSGRFNGGRLVFPEWRTAVDLHHGDLLLMDAHEWHGNTAISCPHGYRELDVSDCTACRGERISVVCYYRERMTECGTPAEEHTKAVGNADRRSHLGGT